MRRTIVLEQEDIKTHTCGLNMAIAPPLAADGLWIILTVEAAKKLAEDIGELLPVLREVREEFESGKF